MNENQAPSKMPLKQGIPITLVAVLLVVAIIAVLTVLKLTIWIVFLGMCVWAAFGMPMNIKEIVKVWASGAFGLLLGYLLTSGALGMPGTIAGFCILLVFIFGIVTHRFSFVCNNYTAIFLTCCTASGIILEPVQMAKSIVGGFILIGFLPWTISSLISKKKVAKAEKM